MFDAYSLSEEHLALRDAVRQLVADKVTPYAAEVDERATFPQEAYDALRASELHAVHVPEVYGGQGADALAACLVIEEVARGCASRRRRSRPRARTARSRTAPCPRPVDAATAPSAPPSRTSGSAASPAC